MPEKLPRQITSEKPDPKKFLEEVRKIEKSFPGARDVTIIPAEDQTKATVTVVFIRNYHAFGFTHASQKQLEELSNRSEEEVDALAASAKKERGEKGATGVRAMHKSFVRTTKAQRDIYLILGQLVKMGATDVFLEGQGPEEIQKFNKYINRKDLRRLSEEVIKKRTEALEEKIQKLSDRLNPYKDKLTAAEVKEEARITAEIDAADAEIAFLNMQDAIDAQLMALKEFHRLKRVRIHSAEKEDLHQEAFEIKSRFGIASPQFKKIQEARDDFALSSIQRSGNTVAVLIFGAAHDFRENRPKDMNLIIITPNHVEEDLEKPKSP